MTDAADVQATPTDNLGPHSFRLGDHVKIIDPDIGIAVFYDEAVPYVANSGLIIQTVGPPSISSNTAYLLSPNLITLDRTTGVVTYDPEAFRFLGEGETAVYKFTFVSASGPDSAAQQLVFTVTGHNDAPVFAVNDTPLAFSESTNQTGQSTSHLIPIKLNFTDEDYSDIAEQLYALRQCHHEGYGHTFHHAGSVQAARQQRTQILSEDRCRRRRYKSRRLADVAI